MTHSQTFDVIIIGGSYSGLASAMSLGRSLRSVLVIDSGKPCNAQTPHSHNFLTRDGETPATIAAIAKKQVAQYNTVQFHAGLAIQGLQTGSGFEITTEAGEVFTSKKLIFATGVRDLFPSIPGFSESWGISVIHCPYCHGYEVKGEKTGLFANGDMAYEFSKMVYNLTHDLTILTHGKSTMTAEQTAHLETKGIAVVETEIEALKHTSGVLEEVVFKDGNTLTLKALYARIPFEQHADIPGELGCALNEQGFLQVDAFQKTTVPGVFACGDCVTPMRSVANAVAMGTLAGAMTNKELVDEAF